MHNILEIEQKINAIEIYLSKNILFFNFKVASKQ